MDLSAMFNTGNPFMTEMGTQAFQADQAKAQQALLTAQGEEQRKQAMAPLEQAHSRATTGYNQALTDQMNDRMAALPPTADRLKEAMLKMHSEGSTLERSQREADMYQRGKWAAMIKANNGEMPLALLGQIPQEELPMFQGKGLDTTISIVKAFHDTHPTTMEARAKEDAAYQRATDVAHIIGTSRVDVATIRGKSGSGGKLPGSPSALMTHYTMKANEEKEGSPEWTNYMALANNEWQKLEALKNQAAAAANAGKLDLPATVQGRTPVVRGIPSPTQIPGAGGKPKPKPGSSPDNPIILK